MDKTQNPGVLLSCSVISLLITSVPALAGDPNTGGPGATLADASSARKGFNIGGVSIGFQPRIYAGVMYYEYEQDGIGNTQQVDTSAFTQAFPNAQTLTNTLSSQAGKFLVRGTFPTVSGGGTLFVDRFFIDVYAQHAFTDSDDDSRKESASATVALTTEVFPGQAIDATVTSDVEGQSSFGVELDRTEWNISGGYSLTDHLAVYAGYKQADTNFDFAGFGGTFDVFTVTTVAPNPPFPGVPPIVTVTPQSGTFTQDQETDFEQDGPFVGATFGLPLNAWIFDGLLAFNAAVAFLNGDITQRTTNSIQTVGGVSSPLVPNSTATVEGDTIGISLGLSWRGVTPIQGFSYLVSIDGQKYDFDGDPARTRFDDGRPEIVGTEGVEFDEFSISFRAGFAYAF